MCVQKKVRKEGKLNEKKTKRQNYFCFLWDSKDLQRFDSVAKNIHVRAAFVNFVKLRGALFMKKKHFNAISV